MKFILNKDKLTVENEECANSGSVQYYEVDVEHDENWNDLSIEAVIAKKEGGAIIFDDAQSIAVIDNKMYIDRELNGSYAIGFRGYKIENEVKIYQISTNLQGVYFNVGAGQIITTNSIPKPTEWEIYVAQIEAIANRASQSADDAQTSAENAETSAENAQTSAETATEQAETATEKASNASASATTATEQAGIATTKAGEASTSATKAKTSEDNAKASEQSASSSASSASASATSAGNSASSASASASSASSSAATASTKANEASASANSASQSATAAAKSKNDAQELVNGFTSTVQTATNAFNTNATEKTNAFNTNATNKTNAFNENATNKTTTFNENAEQKTTDFNDNVEDKTTEFNEVVDTAKDDIEEIAPMLQDKMSKIETFLQPAVKTGTSIHTTDSADWYGKLNFEGFSRQETRSGKNKFDKTRFKNIAKASYIYSDGIYTITPTGAGNVALDIFIDLPAGTYTYSGNGSTTTQIKNSSDTTIANNISTANTTFTIAEAGSYIRFNFGTGTSSDAFIFDTNNIQIEEGSTATDYEEYGVSPSIEFPSEDRNLEGINKFDKNNCIIVDKKRLDDNGNEVIDVNSSYTATYIPVKPNTNYTMQGTNASPEKTIRFYFCDTNKNFVARSKGYQTNIATFTTPDYCHYIQIQFLNIEQFDIDAIMMNEGTTLPEYAPYDSLRFKQIGFNIWDEQWETGYYGALGQPISDNNSIRSKNGSPIYIDPNSNYYVKCPATTKCYVCQFKEDGTFIRRDNRANSIFTPNSECNYIKFNLQNAYGTTYNNDICINVSDPARNGEYEPYKEHNIDFPCNGQKFYAESTLTDNGIEHIRKQIILDGTESWQKYVISSTYNRYQYYTAISGVKYSPTDITIMSNIAKGILISDRNVPENNNTVYTSTNTICFRFDSFDNVEDFKTFLAQQYANGTPVTIEYELAEPETVPYTQAQQKAYNELQNIETYQYVNNIELIANEETNMTLDYKKDIQMQIAERDTEIENIKSRLALLE